MKTTFIFYVYFFLVGFILITAQVLSAQEVPRFTQPIYFEDAVGNKDTIVIYIGSTTNAFNTDSTYFDEDLSDTPMDTTFEVRAARLYNTISPGSLYVYTGHKVTAELEYFSGSSCWTANAIIFVSAKYLPITMTYDNTIIYDSLCQPHIFFSTDQYLF